MTILAIFPALEIYQPSLQHIYILHAANVLICLHVMKILNVLEAVLYVNFHFFFFFFFLLPNADFGTFFQSSRYKNAHISAHRQNRPMLLVFTFLVRTRE